MIEPGYLLCIIKRTHHLVKDVVEKEFCKVDGTVRVVFCTIAFGMGVDVKGAYLERKVTQMT